MIIRQKWINVPLIKANISEKLRALLTLGACRKHRVLWISLVAVCTSILVVYLLGNSVCQLVLSNENHETIRRANGGPQASTKTTASASSSSKSKSYQHNGNRPPFYGFSRYAAVIIHPRVRDVFMSEVFWKSFVATSASLFCITVGALCTYNRITKKRLREMDDIYKVL